MLHKEIIIIIITGSGAPGIAGTIYSLKESNDFVEIKIIGTDINNNAVGKYLCDKFYVIPPCSNTYKYLDALMKICKDENVKLIIPQNTKELEILSKNKELFKKINVNILVSSSSSIDQSNNKYHLLKVAKDQGVPCPDFFLVNNIKDLKKNMELLGWPNNRVVIKPPISNGSRGVRIIDEKIDLKNIFYYEKPDSLFTNFNLLYQVLGKTFDDLLVMEYINGIEYTVDLMNTKKKSVCIPRLRNEIKNGITFSGEVVKNNKIEKYSLILSKSLNLKYCFGFQFIMKDSIPFIIECNPRVQGSMVISTLANANIILNSVLHVLNKPEVSIDLHYGTKFIRYWGGFSEYKNKVRKI